MITVVDYGVGNLGSIINMLKHVGLAVSIADKPDALASASKILLPGVGAFDRAIARIDEAGFHEILDRKALTEKVPILGICLGMQLMTHGSEEGALPGLGWVDARVKRFPAMPNLRIPHMGWNHTTSVKPCPLSAGWAENSKFYFVHSYYVDLADQGDRWLRTQYGIEFDAGFQHGNLFGAQFHPEKSHRFGMELFRNFGAL